MTMEEPTAYQMAILYGLNARRGIAIFGGIDNVIAHRATRRAKSRVARVSRRTNRKRR